MIRAEQLHARIMDELDMTREIEDEELTRLIYFCYVEGCRILLPEFLYHNFCLEGLYDSNRSRQFPHLHDLQSKDIGLWHNRL